MVEAKGDKQESSALLKLTFTSIFFKSSISALYPVFFFLLGSDENDLEMKWSSTVTTTLILTLP